jgi:iron complex transport system ATP-binding protein
MATRDRGDGPTLSLSRVSVWFDDRLAVDDVTWRVEQGERWVIVGPNGCGKTTLLRVAALRLHPSSGTVEVLGERLGHTDVRALLPRIGFTSSALAERLRPTLEAREVVMTARYGALEPWWHDYTDADREQALALLERVNCTTLATHRFGTLSSGERQRVLLARTLMTDPDLVLLDEPAAGLDLGGREELVATLARLAADPAIPATVLVTHHVDEIPPGVTHALLMKDGRVIASGSLRDTLTESSLSELFGLDLRLDHVEGRWSARVR